MACWLSCVSQGRERLKPAPSNRWWMRYSGWWYRYLSTSMPAKKLTSARLPSIKPAGEGQKSSDEGNLLTDAIVGFVGQCLRDRQLDRLHRYTGFIEERQALAFVLALAHRPGMLGHHAALRGRCQRRALIDDLTEADLLRIVLQHKPLAPAAKHLAAVPVELSLQLLDELCLG